MTKKYSILFVHPFIHTSGGPDQSLHSLIQKIDRKQYAIFLTVPKRSQGIEKYEGLVRDILVDVNADGFHHLRNVRSNLSLLIRNLLSYQRIRLRLQRNNIHLVHTNGESAWIYGMAARSLGIPSVVQEHGLTTLANWIGSKLVPAILKFSADELIAVSQVVADAYTQAGYPAQRITVIDNGVDIARFRPAEGGHPQHTSMAGGACNPIIGAVGSADPRKGWLTLVQACAHLRGKFPQLRCIFVGDLNKDKNYTAALKDAVDTQRLQEAVEFAGVLTDLPEVYTRLDVLVQPSVIEAGPRAPIEAMACGVPVVATRVGGNSDYVQDGVTGLLCPPGDPKALANSIDRLLSDADLRQRMGAEGKRVAIERFSLEAHTQKVQAVYERLLGSMN